MIIAAVVNITRMKTMGKTAQSGACIVAAINTRPKVIIIIIASEASARIKR